MNPLDFYDPKVTRVFVSVMISVKIHLAQKWDLKILNCHFTMAKTQKKKHINIVFFYFKHTGVYIFFIKDFSPQKIFIIFIQYITVHAPLKMTLWLTLWLIKLLSFFMK